MFTREVKVQLENGLHLTPSAQIARLAQQFPCSLRIRKGDRAVDAASILDLLTLAAECGTVLHLEAEGDRAEEALTQLSQLFDHNFDPAQEGDTSGNAPPVPAPL